jgi:hypothetical protein
VSRIVSIIRFLSSHLSRVSVAPFARAETSLSHSSLLVHATPSYLPREYVVSSSHTLVRPFTSSYTQQSSFTLCYSTVRTSRAPFGSLTVTTYTCDRFSMSIESQIEGVTMLLVPALPIAFVFNAARHFVDVNIPSRYRWCLNCSIVIWMRLLSVHACFLPRCLARSVPDVRMTLCCQHIPLRLLLLPSNDNIINRARSFSTRHPLPSHIQFNSVRPTSR